MEGNHICNVSMNVTSLLVIGLGATLFMLVWHIIIIYNVGQSDVNLSSLILSCLRILLMHGGVYAYPCSGWSLWFFRRVERIFHTRELNHQLLRLDLGTSPLSSGSFRSSWTPYGPYIEPRYAICRV